MHSKKSTRDTSTIGRETMGNPLFISYAREDGQFVQELERALQKADVPTWMDRKRLGAGDEWADSIQKAILKSPAVILVLSPDAIKSPWVKKETSFATRNHKRIIPLVCRGTEIPPYFDFITGDYQRLDFTVKSFKRGARDLVDAIRQLDLGESAADTDSWLDLSSFTVYLEDIQEFIPKVPRSMFWRFLSLQDYSFWEKVFAILFFTRLPILSLWMLPLVVLLLFNFYWVLVFGIHPRFPTTLLVANALGFLVFGVPTKLLKRWLWRKMVAEVWDQLPYRPNAQLPNKLLDRWDHTVKPIMWEILDRPVLTWQDVIFKRCPDPELRARVVFTVILMTSM